LKNIREALAESVAPVGFVGPHDGGAFDVFAGFMILDALIANRDRHEQNWSVLTPQLLSLPEQLAPSYDHASSLGFNLRDEQRRRHLQHTDQLAAWTEKGTAYRFEHRGRASSLVRHAENAIAMCTDPGAHWWQERLSKLDLGSVHELLEKRSALGMSELAARFASNLLELNLRRLRDAICQRP